MIRIKNLYQIFINGKEKTEVLKDISLSIHKGEFLVIRGRSGSGKSTLLHILAGLLTPSKGSIIVDGIEVNKLNENERSLFRRKHIGLIFQAYHLFPNMSAIDNVEEPLFYAGVKKKERTRRAKEMLERVGLGDRVNHLTHQLSGGQQQRVAIARGLVMDPPIILADEPTGNLDSETEVEVLNLLTFINEKLGKTIVMVTHDDSVASLANRVVEIENGVLIRH